MLILGHTGITLGVATVVAGALKGSPSPRDGKASWLTKLGSYIDIRLLLVGSLLPDIIDKPVGHYFFRETFSNGRIFSHSLLFFILLAAIGFLLYRRRRLVWLLTLAFGTLMHLLLDQMWCSPQTLFWPFLGFAFARGELTDWLPNIFEHLFTVAAVYVPELLGGAIILWFVITLVARHKFTAFIKRGQVS